MGSAVSTLTAPGCGRDESIHTKPSRWLNATAIWAGERWETGAEEAMSE
jgi:hypothetical protein